jgi:hypothetical protein
LWSGSRRSGVVNIDDAIRRPEADNRPVLGLRKLFGRRDHEDDHWFEFWNESEDAERFTPDVWAQIEPHVIGLPVSSEIPGPQTPD